MGVRVGLPRFFTHCMIGLLLGSSISVLSGNRSMYYVPILCTHTNVPISQVTKPEPIKIYDGSLG